jgi:hypothetical protein
MIAMLASFYSKQCAASVTFDRCVVGGASSIMVLLWVPPRVLPQIPKEGVLAAQAPKGE